MKKAEIIKVLKHNGLMLAEMSEVYRNDKQMVLFALENNPFALQYVGAKLIDDFEVVEYAYINKRSFANYENPGDLSLIQYTSQSFRSNEKVLLKLLRYDGLLINYFPAHYLQEVYFMKQAVSKNGMIMLLADENIKNNREIVLIAAKENGYFLSHSSFVQYHNDREMMLEGCISNVNLIESITSEFKNDFDFAKELFSKTKCPIHAMVNNFSENIWRNKDFILSAFVLNQELLLKVVTDMKCFNDEPFILKIFENFPREHMFLKVFFKLLLRSWNWKKVQENVPNEKVILINNIVKSIRN